MNTNRDTALARKAHLHGIQEACLTEAQIRSMKAEASKIGKAYIGGPTDPEQGKAAAGVGALSIRGLGVYEVQNPTKDYLDAV